MSNTDKAFSKNIIVTISDYKNEFKKRLLLIISIAIIFSLLGFGFSKLQEEKYEVVSSFIVDVQSEGANLSSISGVASQFGIDLGGNASSSLSQKDVIQLLKSRLIIERTLNKKATIGGKIDLLLNHYIRINNLITDSSVINFSDNYKDSITTVVYSTINKEDMNILFQNDEANILNLSFISLNAEFAKKFSEIIIDEMKNDYKKSKTEKSRIILNVLKAEEDSISRELELSRKALARVKDKNARVISYSGRVEEAHYITEVMVLEKTYLLLREQIAVENYKLLHDTPLIQVIDKPVVPYESINRHWLFWVLIFSFLGVFTIMFIIMLRKLVRDALQEEV